MLLTTDMMRLFVLPPQRFLMGDDDYRKSHMKIACGFVEAPYAVRLLAPKHEKVIHRPGGCETTYTLTKDGACPVLELTLDFVGNATIRGMASLVKRSLKSLSVDLALVISGDDDEEPEGCLGLFRMDHLDIAAFPDLPDRFSLDEGRRVETSPESDADARRAQFLLTESRRQSVLIAAN